MEVSLFLKVFNCNSCTENSVSVLKYTGGDNNVWAKSNYYRSSSYRDDLKLKIAHVNHIVMMEEK